jgi:hypothetical protein
MFMGGDPGQPLTTMPASHHQRLHVLLNRFLRTKTNSRGEDMSPRRGNSGQRIRGNFPRDERLDALKDFYEKYGEEFPRAAGGFFDQHCPKK